MDRQQHVLETIVKQDQTASERAFWSGSALLFCLHHLNTFIYAICMLFKIRGDYHDYSNFSVSNFSGSLQYKDEDHSSHHLYHQILVSSTSSISGPPWPSFKARWLFIIRSVTAVGLSLTRKSQLQNGMKDCKFCERVFETLSLVFWVLLIFITVFIEWIIKHFLGKIGSHE